MDANAIKNSMLRKINVKIFVIMVCNGSVNNKNVALLHCQNLKINVNIIKGQTHKMVYVKTIAIVQLHGMIELIMYALKLVVVFSVDADKYLIIPLKNVLYKGYNVPKRNFITKLVKNVK